MTLCIFNPEHDLCLANGNAHYVPPQSAVAFARRDARLMRWLYPEAVCRSVYDADVAALLASGSVSAIVAWGWNVVLREQLLKLGADEALLPSEAQLELLRRLQHRATILPLQPDCRELHSEAELRALLHEGQGRPLVLKAPWSGAGRGLRWLRCTCSDKDLEWLRHTLGQQGSVVAEPWRRVEADVALEYVEASFAGYSCFETRAGVYRQNRLWPDSEIEACFAGSDLQQVRQRVEQWLAAEVWPRYRGPMGVDLMLADGCFHVAEMNLRHTMGMVAHAQIEQKE